MSWITDLMYALGFLGGISDRKISTGPLTKREIVLLKNEITILILKAEEALSKDLHHDARRYFINALNLEKINPESLPDSVNILKRSIEQVENILNKDTINKAILTLEKGDYLRNEAKFQEAFDEYQKAFSLIKTMTICDSELRAVRINEIYLKQINCLIEAGNTFRSTNLNEKSAEAFNKAVEVAGRMISSVEKSQIMKKLNKIVDNSSEKIKGMIELGISLTNQNQFERATQLFREAQTILKEKYSKLPNTITNRFQETSDFRDVGKLIEKSIKKIRIDANTAPLLGSSFDDIEEEKEIHILEQVKSDQSSKYTCEYCGIELNEKPRFCPKCGIICRENFD